MENNTEIKLVQNPIIKHELMKIGKSVTERLSELNLENQVATNDTIQTLKKLRAELNKEHSKYKGQFKAVKDAVLKPVNEIEPIYKSEISEKYENADTILKDKIGDFENLVKKEKQDEIIIYFHELCQSEKIDFLYFENTGIEINLSTTKKAYKEKCNEFVKKVVDDLALINTNEFQAEILVEYKKSLNASNAITTVTVRKEAERKEKERLFVIEKNRRIELLKKLGLVFMDMTNAYEYDAEIYLAVDKIEKLTKAEFEKVFIEIEVGIKAKKQAEQSPTNTPEILKPIEQPVIKTPLSAPKVEVKEETVTASFEVTGTMPQLRALGQYMKSNNITYKNI
jgi:hypothetical protein